MITRFADRDITMRYHWGMGIGHTYSHDQDVDSQWFPKSIPPTVESSGDVPMGGIQTGGTSIPGSSGQATGAPANADEVGPEDATMNEMPVVTTLTLSPSGKATGIPANCDVDGNGDSDSSEDSEGQAEDSEGGDSDSDGSDEDRDSESADSEFESDGELEEYNTYRRR